MNHSAAPWPQSHGRAPPAPNHSTPDRLVMVLVCGQDQGRVVDRGAVPPSLSDMSFGPPSSGSDEHSFIVLERETAEDVENMSGLALAASMRSVNLASNGFMPNGVVTNHFGEGRSPGATPVASLQEINSHLSDGSVGLPADVQQRMDSLIQENLNLQVTVDQTNSDLRQMMMTLAQWRGDMEKLREDHKEKFQETKNLVFKLKKEKAELRAVNEELQKKLEELEGKVMPSLFEAVVPTVNEMELNSKVDDLQSQLDVVTAARDTEIEKNGTYVEEISSLKQDLIKLKKCLKEREKEIENNKAGAESLQKAGVEELQILREENARLKSEMDNLSSVERHSQEYYVAQTKGFNHRIDELTAKLMCTEEELQKAQTEVAKLKGMSKSSTSNEEAVHEATATVERLRLRIDEMTAKIVELEQKCETQAREITAWESSDRQQNEAKGILQAQVEVYQADFIAERDCRQRLAGEKEQLAEDLRRLHRQNLELQNQLASQANPGPPTNNRNEGHASEAAGGADESNSIYRCPICNTMTFRTLQAVNEHIDRCLGGFTDMH